MRVVKDSRKTTETNIQLKLNIDGQGKVNISTGIGFFDHMLTLFAVHGMFDLSLKCEGDLYVDGHHTVEDIGILLGSVFKKGLGDKKGIKRYASLYSPMDEALSLIALDISGRPHLSFDVQLFTPRVGEFETQLVREFFNAFVNNSGITLHIKEISGENDHHIIEGIFKGFGRALDQATSIDPRIEGVLSTKGVI
ncbi:imidazoleglycerol-phosphate dehydratase HisB [Clostridiisalibacter paucivorans]|uniref:imidazoleglycerol-phosphate dehydratase HisB n=1 Tax=Clostridiisalibacter paucivorans TaxID=408753 RepID=UPI00047DAF36|nr:imidazoleglycerol-phosphate dehydratase HisB [Clostridiisalibacter paucivorans]